MALHIIGMKTLEVIFASYANNRNKGCTSPPQHRSHTLNEEASEESLESEERRRAQENERNWYTHATPCGNRVALRNMGRESWCNRVMAISMGDRPGWFRLEITARCFFLANDTQSFIYCISMKFMPFSSSIACL